MNTRMIPGLLLAAVLFASVPAQAAIVSQLNITGGSLAISFPGLGPVSGSFSATGTMIMGSYQAPPSLLGPFVVGGNTFTFFTHPGPDAPALPPPSAETSGTTITANLTSLFTLIAGPSFNAALNIGNQPPSMATGTFNPETGAFSLSWIHLYQGPNEALPFANLTLQGGTTAGANPVPLPGAALLFGSGLATLGTLMRKLMLRGK